MTCIVGVVEAGRVVMGCDSAGVFEGSYDLILRAEDDPKLIHWPDVGVAMAISGPRRVHHLLRYHFTPVGAAHEIVEQFRELLEAHGRVDTKDSPPDWHGMALMAVDGALWHLDGHFAMMRVTDVIAIGCGDQPANGAMWALRHLMPDTPARTLAEAGLKAAERWSGGVRAPFVYVEA